MCQREGCSNRVRMGRGKPYRYCSWACRYPDEAQAPQADGLYTSRRGEAQCGYCGEAFTPKVKSKGLYCSYVCTGKAKSAGLIAYKPRPPRPWQPKAKHLRRFMRAHRVGVTAYRVALFGSPYVPQPRTSCADCDGPIVERGRHRCTTCRDRSRREHKRAAKHRRRAAKHGTAPSDSYLRSEIFERDAWRCHLCHRKVSPRYKAPHPKSATVDHIIPISDGGKDSRDNVATAHWHCNTDRGAGGYAQLRLVG